MKKLKGPAAVFASRRFQQLAIVLTVLLSLYIASFGPMCWLVAHRGWGNEARTAVGAVYYPMLLAADLVGLQEVVRAYGRFWTPETTRLNRHTGGASFFRDSYVW